MARNSEFELVFLCAVAGGSLIYSGFKRFRNARRIQDTPTSSIQHAPQGLVEVQGVAHAIGKNYFRGLQHPQILCAHYSIQRFESVGRSRKWVPYYEGIVGTRFLIRDDSGWAQVLSKNAEFELEAVTRDWDSITIEGQMHLMKTVVPHLKAVHGSTLNFEEGRWRVIEKSVHHLEPVFVLGCLKSRSHEPEVQAFMADEKLVGVQPVGGIMKSSPHPLFIADCHQTELLHRIASWNLVRMVGGAVLISVAAFFAVTKIL